MTEIKTDLNQEIDRKMVLEANEKRPGTIRRYTVLTRSFPQMVSRMSLIEEPTLIGYPEAKMIQYGEKGWMSPSHGDTLYSAGRGDTYQYQRDLNNPNKLRIVLIKYAEPHTNVFK